MSKFPENYLYTKEHEWISIEGNTGTIGVTSYAIEALGDVVHIEFPSVGKSLQQGDVFGSIESTKTVSDLYIPAGGKVIAVNEELKNAPEKVTEDPHGKYWLIKIEIQQAPQGLLNAADYEKYVAESSH